MKYSTLRSKRCAPSRWSRMAAFVSGVIQLSRPISSSGPHGLADTLRPSFSCRASGRARDRAPSRSPPQRLTVCGLLDAARRRARAGGGRTGAARTPPGGDDRLVARLLDVDVGDEQRLARSRPPRPAERRSGSTIWLRPQNSAVRSSHPVRDQEEDAVLVGARRSEQLGVGPGGDRPVGRVARRCPRRRARASASARGSAGRSRSRSRSGRAACRRPGSSSPGTVKRSTPRNGRWVLRYVPISPSGPTSTAALQRSSPSRSSSPQTTCTPRRAQAAASASVDGPGSPRRRAAPRRRSRTRSPGSRTRAARATRRRPRRPPRGAPRQTSRFRSFSPSSGSICATATRTRGDSTTLGPATL